MFADKKNLLSVCVAVGLLCLGFFAGQHYRPIKKSIGKNDFRGGKISELTNPLLDCTEIENVSNKTILTTRDNVANYIEDIKKEGVETVAVYFRDLNNGPWFGIGEKDDFLPASLLKVPLMMAVFKQSMKDKQFLEEIHMATGSENGKEFFQGTDQLVAGKNYTVDQMVESMIIHSDNNASKLLNSFISIEVLKKTFVELGAEFPDKPGYSISIRTYASFFRILYNSTFLNQELSEKALRLLSKTDFKAGLVAGVPKKLTVAHKFGERQMSDGKKQLHDCGIVYYPDKPYIICVMTRGTNFDQLAGVIARISEEVYAGVNSD
jgi:beta-lactamase class A